MNNDDCTRQRAPVEAKLRTTVFTVLGATLALSAVAGCGSRTTGDEGNFIFEYSADDDLLNFNKPVAVGAKLDMVVKDVGEEQPVTLTAAAFDDETILKVTTFSGNGFTIEAVAEGGAKLEVEGTTAAGDDEADSLDLRAAVPEVLKMRHTCTGEAGSAAYLVNSPVVVAYDMEESDGEPVIGYGYYPVTASDNAALTLDDAGSGQVFLRFETGASAADVVLTSDLADASTLEVKVVSKAMVTDIEDPTAYVIEDIDVGDTNAFYVRPQVADDVVCQANMLKTVVSLTPDICDVRDRNAEESPGELAQNEFGWFEIEGVAEGECQYEVTYPDADGGNGVTRPFSYPIEP